MDRIKPQKLRKNDEIRIIAPSSMPPMKELSEGMEILKKMGYRVSLGKNLKKHSYVSEFSAPVEERLEDLHQAFKDDVKAIFCAKGGHGTINLLDEIDYELIRENPKIFLGYSDITALHMAFQEKSGLITFHGPMPSSDLETLNSPAFIEFMDILGGNTKSVYFNPDRFIKSNGKPDAEGITTGTNLSVATALFNTEYMPNPSDKIFLLEDTNVRYGEIDRELFNISHSYLKEFRAYVFGEFKVMESSREPNYLTQNAIHNFSSKVGKLCLFDMPFGHGKEHMLLPLNAKVRISSEFPYIELLEDIVE